MSKGGKYIIQQNEDGRIQDAITLNLPLLEDRLKEIREKECRDPLKPRILIDIAQTHNVFIKRYYKPTFPVAYEWTAEPLDSGTIFGFNTTNRFLLPVYGDFIGEMILYVKFSGLSAVSPLDKCYYCDFPGHRIAQLVSLTFSGNVIDQYTADAYNVYYNYHVPDDKKKSWLRAVGQEFPEEAILRQSPLDETRESKKILHGPQTPKNIQDDLELYIPILFDTSMKPHCALFSAAIPFGQRFVEITTPPLNQIIYVENNGGGGLFNAPNLTCSLWINQFFIHQPVVYMLKQKPYITPIRTFKYATFEASISDTQKIDLLRLQAENFYFGMRPDANINPTDWWRFHHITPTAITYPVRIPNPLPPPISQLAFNTANLNVITQPITATNFMSRDVVVNNPAAISFYSVLQPLAKSISPQDPGLVLFSFAQRNGFRVFGELEDSDNITSYFNISNQREFYMSYATNPATLPGTIYILARVINWLIIRQDGNVEIKYRN